MVEMSEKEKEKQKKLIGFDKAKELYSNISGILDAEDWGWKLTNKYTLKPDTLTLSFMLKESTVENELEKLDKKQQRIDNFGEEAKVIPE